MMKILKPDRRAPQEIDEHSPAHALEFGDE